MPPVGIVPGACCNEVSSSEKKLDTVDVSSNSFSYKEACEFKGLVLIFNYVFRNFPAPWNRRGSEWESECIRTTFEKLGYKVFWAEDKSRIETFRVLRRIATRELENVGSLILFFLSHGEGEKKDSYFHTVDNNTISVLEICQYFSNTNCPAIVGKPKIIFLSYCNSENRQMEQFNSGNKDAKLNHNFVGDLAIVQATSPKGSSYDIGNGSVFIRCLCETISKHHARMDFQDIVYHTGEKMKKLKFTAPSSETIMFRKFTF